MSDTFLKINAYFELYASNAFKTSLNRSIKRLEKLSTAQKHRLEYSTGRGSQVIMIEYERNVLKSSVLHKQGQGEVYHLVKDCVGKSTAHNIIKTFRDTGEMSA